MLAFADCRSSGSSDRATGIFYGVVLLFLCSQLSIPIGPVPITLQTVGVMVLSLSYDRYNAIVSYLFYLFLGSIGLPMFASYACGIAVLFGSTGGYLLGMLFCTVVVSYAKDYFGMRSVWSLICYPLIGMTCVFSIGVPWLSCFIGLKSGILYGLIPFIVPGILKSLFVTWYIGFSQE